MKKPYIVISNDDGINAKGFKELYSAIPDGCEILAIAPSNERSGASHSVTLDKPLTAEIVKFLYIHAYKVNGTPTDCVKLALANFIKRVPDLVVSGINHGPNTASNIIYSGTIGAAAEAAFLGIPALAFSLYSYDEDADFTFAKKIIRNTIKKVLKKEIKIKKYGLLNVNIPYVKENKIKGIKILPLGKYFYNEKYRCKGKGNKREYFLFSEGRKIQSNKTGMTDAHAIEKGFVTMTPLHFDMTDYGFLKELRNKTAHGIISE